MSLQTRLIGYLAALHGVFLLLSFTLYRKQPLLVVALEALLLLSLAGGIVLIKKTLQPFAFARQFHQLLQDQNYTARLRASTNRELNDLVEVFNHMLEALYQERLKLGEQRGFLERLLEATPSAVLVFDFDGGISLQNASAQALLGLAQAQGRPLRAWLDGDGAWQAQLTPAARQGALALIAQLDTLACGDSKLCSDTDGRRYRCQRSQFFDRGFARQFVLIDELTVELENSEKATYEKLVRVLAHEVNNTVAATGSVLESLLFYRSQLRAEDDSDFSTAIAAVQGRNRNLGEFIERFTRVVKMPEPERRPTDLNQMLEGILRLLRPQCSACGIALGWTPQPALPAQMLDPQLMEQALLNILKNALEAVQATQQAGGATAAYIRLELGRPDGRLQLAVIDSGNRLSEVPSGQLFTPFFSTKKGGQGIGLMFVREVLNRHGYSHRLAADGLGETRFEIFFGDQA